jgi:hypothetical protein
MPPFIDYSHNLPLIVRKHYIDWYAGGEARLVNLFVKWNEYCVVGFIKALQWS